MVRPKGKPREIGNTSAEDMAGAIKLVTENHLSLREAAKATGIAFQTLHRYVKKSRLDPDTEIRTRPLYEARQIFTKEQETLLSKYVEECSKMAYGLSTVILRKVAYDMAKENNISVPPSWEEKKCAGKEWMRGFLYRNQNLSIRKPEPCSLSRLTSFNRHNVEAFFTNLESVLKRYPQLANGSRVFNLDETGLTTVQKPKKIIAQKGLKQLNQVTSGERGELVTLLVCISAVGTFIPPVMIFPRKNFKQHMVTGAPAGTLGLAHPSGWMTLDNFTSVIEHFIKYTCSKKDNPTLLICDNHESHMGIRVLDIAKENGVIMLTLPPHCSHKMQPLDLTVFGPLKAYYNTEVDAWMLRNPGVPITIYQIAECIGHGLPKALTPSNIIAGFNKSGIFPFNRNIFTDSDFLSSSVTDRPLENPISSTSSAERQAELQTAAENEQPSVSSSGENLSIFGPSTSGSTKTDNNEGVVASLSKDMGKKEFISPKIFRGFPKALPRKKSTGRQRGRSIILTDTPEKDLIAEKSENRKKKQDKIKEKAKIMVTKTLFNKTAKQSQIQYDDSTDDEDESQVMFTKKVKFEIKII